MNLQYIKHVNCVGPHDVIFNTRDQNILISSFYSLRVYDKNLKLLSSLDSRSEGSIKVGNPYGICIQSATNNTIVSYCYEHRILVFPNISEYKESKYLYSIGSNNPSRNLGQFYNPTGVVCNNLNHIIVSDYHNHRVQILDEKGRFIKQIGITDSYESSNKQFFLPNYVCTDKIHDRIFISDYANRRVSIWNKDGSQFIQHVLIHDSPKCLTIDNLGRLLVGCKNNISLFDINFNKLQIYENHNTHKVLNDITGMCVDDENHLILSNHLNDNIQMCNLQN